MEPFLSVYGHVTLDQILTVKDFPKENTSENVLTKKILLGGTGTNIAVVAASLGVPTAICSFVGTDFPAEYEEYMKSKELIMDEFVRTEIPTSQAILINDKNLTQRALFFQGPTGCASSLNNLLTKNAKKSKFVHFCTGEPRYYIDVMKASKNENNLISFDPAQEVHKIWNKELFNEAFQYTDLLFCNQFESESVMRYLDVDDMSMIRKGFVLRTKGSEGCELYLDGEKMTFPIIKADKVEDATGAGDSFRAGFYAGQYRGMSIEESVITGAATASFIVEKVGALSNVPTWDMVMERADKRLSKC